jgi:hypothetical protein
MNKLLFLGVFGMLNTTLLLGQQTDQKFVIEKGTWYTAGTISFTNSDNDFERPDNSDNQKSFGFNLAPKVGYAIKNKLMVGIGLNYGRTKNEGLNTSEGISENSESLSQSFIISPFLRTYKGLSSNLALFLQGELGYSRGWLSGTENDRPEFTGNQNQYTIGVRPGLTYFMSKKLALETTIGSLVYSKFDSEGSEANTSSGSNFSLSLNTTDLFFGVANYF